MADLSGPIRKLESRSRHHRAVAALDREYSTQCGDAIEAATWLLSAADHEASAVNYDAAIEILKGAQ